MIADTYRYNSVDVARYIVARANEEHLGINMTKMQKLLYIAYGAYMGTGGEGAFGERAPAGVALRAYVSNGSAEVAERGL